MRKSSKGGTPRRAKVQRAKAGRVKAHRAKPGARGTGRFFHIQVRPRTEFVTFRNQDVGARGGIERVAGRRANGTWDTQKWLVGKTQAHLDGKQLAPDTAAARKLLAQSVFDDAAQRAVRVGGQALELTEHTGVDGERGAHDRLHTLQHRAAAS